MTRDEFLGALERELAGLHHDERESALSYYREYLDEAGTENEADALEQLGSPESVAKRIIAEAGVSNEGMQRPQSGLDYGAIYRGEPLPETESVSVPAGRVALAVVVMVMTSPLWITLFSLWLAFTVAQAAVLAALCFTGIAAPFQGIHELVQGMTSYGLFDLGCGLFCIGLVILLSRPLDFLVKKGWGLLKKGFLVCLNALLGKENKA